MENYLLLQVKEIGIVNIILSIKNDIDINDIINKLIIKFGPAFLYHININDPVYNIRFLIICSYRTDVFLPWLFIINEKYLITPEFFYTFYSKFNTFEKCYCLALNPNLIKNKIDSKFIIKCQKKLNY